MAIPLLNRTSDHGRGIFTAMKTKADSPWQRIYFRSPLVKSGLAISLILVIALVFSLKKSLDGHDQKASTAPTPSFEVLPADSGLTTEVKKTVEVSDSYQILRTGSYYQLHVVLDERENFRPIGIQIIDPTAHVAIVTAELVFEPNSYCSRKPVYQTKWLVGLPVSELVYNKRLYSNRWPVTPYQVVLFVETEQGSFSVSGLEVNSECSGGIE